MTNRKKMGLLISSVSMLAGIVTHAGEGVCPPIRREWVEEHEVADGEDGLYIDTHKGPVWLKIIDYDEEHHRYLVEYPPHL